jgi:4-methyl-5(b-hydroxyethyl)-thiazole monophosphate biosynthesis
MATILAIVADGFEEIETVTPIDILRRAGFEVILSSLATDLQVKGKNGIVVNADRSLKDAAPYGAYTCLLLPGGPHVWTLRKDPRVTQLCAEFAKSGRWIAAICAAPLLLKDAGVLSGHRYTAHFSVNDELPGILSGLRVVADGKILTSRGAGTAVDFGLALVEQLASPAKAREVSVAICA